MEKETRKQALKRFEKLMEPRLPGHLICRTCGESGCCILAHDNTLPKRDGDKFEKNGKITTFYGHKSPFKSEPVQFGERKGGFIDEEATR